MLEIIDQYALHLENDEPLVLALRRWPDKAISRYHQREGLSASALRRLERFFADPATTGSITEKLLAFVETAKCSTPEVDAQVAPIALDATCPTSLRSRALNIIATRDNAESVLSRLDPISDLSTAAFRALVQRQDRPTIERALAAVRMPIFEPLIFHHRETPRWVGSAQ